MPSAAAPSTLFEADDQLPGESVQIQIDEPESPAERPDGSRAEPAPQDGGSPKQVPEPKESGPKDSGPGVSNDYDAAAGMDLNVFGSDDDVQLVASPEADEQHDADDGDDEEDERVHDARQAGAYPPRAGDQQRRGN